MPKRPRRGRRKDDAPAASNTPPVDGIDPKDLAAQFGWNLAVLKSDPDLYGVFRQAVKNDWTPDRFVAEVRSTGWFQTHSDATRNYIILKKSDPKTYAARLNQARASVRDIAVGMGAQVTDKFVDRVADNFLRFGWNDAQLRDTLAGSVGPGALGSYGGQAAANVTHLRAVAQANGVKLADKTVQGWAVRLAAGESIEGFDEYVRNTASAAFPAWADRIKAGENVEDIADPYRQQMAETLELNPESVDLFDPTLRGALQAQTKDGQVAAKPLWQFEAELRKDERFDKTQRARTDAAKFESTIAQTFGAI